MIDPNNEIAYPMWKDIPVPFYMSVYFFNVLNPKEVLLGEKPMVEERGPYVYRSVDYLPWCRSFLNSICRVTIFASTLYRKGSNIF